MTFTATFWRCLTGKVSLAGTNWRKTLWAVLIGTLAGTCVALALEPDHTSGLPLLAAFGLWSTHILFALLLFVGSLALLIRIGLADPLPAVISTLLLPAIFAPVSLLLDIGFGKPDAELASATGLPGLYLSEVAAVLPVSLAAALLMLAYLYRDAASREVPVEAATAGGECKPERALNDLINAIPTSLGNDIIRMHAQDHYVEVVTTEGRVLILESLGECAQRLEGIDGIRCHRSHWISLCHVKELSPSGSAFICEMSNGDRVQVSRRRHADLKKRLADSSAKQSSFDASFRQAGLAWRSNPMVSCVTT